MKAKIKARVPNSSKWGPYAMDTLSTDCLWDFIGYKMQSSCSWSGKGKILIDAKWVHILIKAQLRQREVQESLPQDALSFHYLDQLQQCI